jgi:hypothetical protein
MYNIYFYEKFEWDYVKTIDGLDSFPIGFYTLSFGGKCLEFLIDTKKHFVKRNPRYILSNFPFILHNNSIEVDCEFLTSLLF